MDVVYFPLAFQVLLFSHVPPGKFERFYQYYEEIGENGFPWFSSDFNEAYLDLVHQFADVLLPQVSARVQGTRSGEGTKKGGQSSSPSFS